jgi:pimeloyl-ACP methyl ester carboxylesterase
VDIDGVNLHFVHQTSPQMNAIPLIIVHGWPGTFYEFDGIIEPLINPPAGKQAFHVIIPSVPGFGLSSTPHKKGWTVRDTARLFDKLVTDVLGYKSYAAQGGDWVGFILVLLLVPSNLHRLPLKGSIISTVLSEMPHCKAVHLNMCTVPPPFPYAIAGLVLALPTWLSSRLLKWYFSPEEHRQMMRSKDFIFQAGYFGMQATQVNIYLMRAILQLDMGLAFHDRFGIKRLSNRLVHWLYLHFSR